MLATGKDSVARARARLKRDLGHRYSLPSLDAWRLGRWPAGLDQRAGGARRRRHRSRRTRPAAAASRPTAVFAVGRRPAGQQQRQQRGSGGSGARRPSRGSVAAALASASPSAFRRPWQQQAKQQRHTLAWPAGCAAAAASGERLNGGLHVAAADRRPAERQRPSANGLRRVTASWYPAVAFGQRRPARRQRRLFY